jgi:putative DNA primase/helicase
MKKFLDFATSLNFEFPNLELDGKIHRFVRNRNEKSKNAWYVGFQNHAVKTGEVYIYVEFGDWKTGEKHSYRPDIKYSREDKQALVSRMAEAKAAAEKQRQIDQADAAERAEKIWNMANTTYKDHPYYLKKQLKGHFNLRIDRDALLIPMFDDSEKMIGLQRIFPDGGKFFMTGQSTKGAFHVIGNVEDGINYICEGFATGASIHMATGKSVVIAFNAGNLVEVAKVICVKYPSSKFIVCGDDDRATDGNPGRTKAEKAAIILSTIPMFPQCKGSDFNDVMLEFGLEELKRQVADNHAMETGFIPLGFKEFIHFFYSRTLKQVVKISSFNDVQIFMLNEIEYWLERFPGKKSGIDWTAVKSFLVSISKNVGVFDPDRIRGVGVWSDQNRIIVNTGVKLIVDGESMQIGKLKSRYFYLQDKALEIKYIDKILTIDEADTLRKLCFKFNWRESKSGYLLAGWLAVARIAGALPIRPHIWLTGGAGSGKSTLMEKLINPILGDDNGKKYFLGGSTEAGIRQAIRSDSIPVIFDEFETIDLRTNERVQTILELLRQSWSSSAGVIVKGSAGGLAQNYNLNMAALVSSIRVSLQNDADRSRFSILELDATKNNSEHWNEVKSLLSKINVEFGDKLFARSIKLLPIIKASQEILQRHFADKFSQRVGQQYGMLLAGYYSLISDEIVTDDIAKSMVEEMSEDDINANENIADEENCLQHLLTSRIQITNIDGKSMSKSISMIITDNASREIDQLEHFGMRYGNSELYVASNNTELAKIFHGTAWGKNWNRSLRRQVSLNPKNKKYRIGGVVVNTVCLNIKHLLER